jgi:cytoskeletal protein CcmA (bactofilin family)
MTSSLRRSLKHRIVLCSDCNASRTLAVSASGSLVCSSCGSDNWMYFPVSAILRESISIKGELRVEQDFTIEGRVEGRIELKDHTLRIARNARVRAEIYAKTVIIAGDVIGNIFATDTVQVQPSGSLLGNVKCPHISILEGAVLKGRIDTGLKTGIISKADSLKAGSAQMG